MQTAHQGNIGQSIPIKYESMSIYFQRISIILAENVDKNQKMKNQLSSKSWIFTIFHFRTFATNSSHIYGFAILLQKLENHRISKEIRWFYGTREHNGLKK